MPRRSTALLTSFFTGIFSSSMSMLIRFFSAKSFRQDARPPLVGSLACLIRGFIEAISSQSGLQQVVTDVSKSKRLLRIAVAWSPREPERIILSPGAISWSRIVSVMPIAVVLMIILSILPFCITFVSPVTTGMPVFLEITPIESIICSRCSFLQRGGKLQWGEYGGGSKLYSKYRCS